MLYYGFYVDMKSDMVRIHNLWIANHGEIDEVTITNKIVMFFCSNEYEHTKTQNFLNAHRPLKLNLYRQLNP